MDECKLEKLLTDALWVIDDNECEGEQKIKNIRPFYEANLLAKNRGVVLTMRDSSEFQITIVQSKLADFTK